MRELCDFLLQTQGKWEEVTAPYFEDTIGEKTEFERGSMKKEAKVSKKWEIGSCWDYN